MDEKEAEEITEKPLRDRGNRSRWKLSVGVSVEEVSGKEACRLHLCSYQDSCSPVMELHPKNTAVSLQPKPRPKAPFHFIHMW